MCGITGLIDYCKTSSAGILEEMTDTLFHRGPDGSGIEFIEDSKFQIGLGHRRLSIIDLSERGKQPMSYNSLFITFNGEIYNYRKIKSELVSLGHKFYSSSDTEMILHAYAEWKEDCLQKFIGMFAFVIFDKKLQTVFCARDRAGVKPFFYYWNDGLFLFGSELKSFHKHPDFKKEINLDSVGAFMQYGNVPTPFCIFQNCSKLKPAHYLVFDLENRSIITKAYWNVYDAYKKEKTNIPFEEARQKTESILASAFEYRMVADVPVGIFLSGGYDSACVTSLLQKDRTRKLKTFTIGVPDIGLNEAPYAKKVAEHLGTDHHEFYCTQKEAIELIDDLPSYYDEPFADSSAIPTTLVSKMARGEVKVALSADGGDEIFAGYNRYDFLLRYGDKLNKIPAFARKFFAGLMNVVPARNIPVLRNKYNFHNRYEKLKGILKEPSPEKIMLSLSQQYTDQQMEGVLKQSVNKLNTSYINNELKNENYSPLSYMMAIDYQTYLVDDILQKVDRATMASGLEGREPFLDHRIIEWAATLPDSYKYFNGEKKYILKEIVHQYIPKSMMERSKMGFAIPIAKWMKEDLRDRIESFTSDEIILQQGIFNLNYVIELKKGFFRGREEYDVKLWYLLMFQMWFHRWM